MESNKEHLLEETLQKINELLGTNIVGTDINNIYTIGKAERPPIIIEFISYIKKRQLQSQTTKLRGTRIGISNDLCAEDRETQKKLRVYLKKAKTSGQNARIKGNQLEIDNTLYTLKQLERQEGGLSSGETNSESEDDSSSDEEKKETNTDQVEINTAPKPERKRKNKTPSPRTRNQKKKK